MNTDKEILSIANIDVDVVRKDIKNMHLAVYPPHGRIRLSAPNKTDPEVLRLFAISKLGWIKKHVKNFKEQPREPNRDYLSGESHYLEGKRFLLTVIEREGPSKVELSGTKKIILYVSPEKNTEQRAKVMKEWYRTRLKFSIPALLEKWEKEIGVRTNGFGVRHMKTKWGSCNIEAKKIYINLELAKKPVQCLEFIIVHELVHLLERNHNNRFIAFMDQFMPKWRLYREELNNLPVSHIDWRY